MGVVGNINAQNKNLEAARLEFKKGNYKDAVGLYNGAIAIVANQKEKEYLIKERERTSKCWKFLDEAERLYSIKNYSLAIKSYTQVCSLNSYDVYARKQINKCRQNLQDATYIRNRDKQYKDALQKGDSESIKAFLRSYPNDKAKGLLTFIMSDKEDIEDSLITIVQSQQTKAVSESNLTKDLPPIIQNFIKAGDAFYNAQNISSAQEYYGVAASYGSAEAIYKNALCFNNSSVQYRNLMALAAAAGHSSAEKKLQQLVSKFPYLKYDEYVANRMYENLQTYMTDIKAAIYVYENKENYSIKGLNPGLYIQKNKNMTQQLRNLIYGDNLLYHAGIILSKTKEDPSDIMLMAASEGNVNAVKWWADKYNDARFKRCYEYFQKKEDFTPYIKYLKGHTLTAEDWHAIYSSRYRNSSLDRHEILLAIIKSKAFSGKALIKVLKNHTSKYNLYWDSNIIKDIRISTYTLYATQSSKTIKKIIKIISKLKVKSGVYNIKTAPMYDLVNLGCYDNQHEYKQLIVKETLWNNTTPPVAPARNRSTNTNRRNTTTPI